MNLSQILNLELRGEKNIDVKELDSQNQITLLGLLTKYQEDVDMDINIEEDWNFPDEKGKLSEDDIYLISRFSRNFSSITELWNKEYIEEPVIEIILYRSLNKEGYDFPPINGGIPFEELDDALRYLGLKRKFSKELTSKIVNEVLEGNLKDVDIYTQPKIELDDLLKLYNHFNAIAGVNDDYTYEKELIYIAARIKNRNGVVP